MKYLTIALLLLSVTAYSQKDSTVIKLTGWQLEQVAKFDATDKEIQQAAQLNSAARETFFKTVIGRDVTAQDSVTYNGGKIVIFKRKAKPKP